MSNTDFASRFATSSIHIMQYPVEGPTCIQSTHLVGLFLLVRMEWSCGLALAASSSGSNSTSAHYLQYPIKRPTLTQSTQSTGLSGVVCNSSL